MTLIVSAICPAWAMQASDRRLSTSSGDRSVDASNKAVFAAERVAFAYTGRAEISGDSTDAWLQLQLSRHLGKGMELEGALAELATMLTQYFRALPSSDRNRALAFIGSGWTKGRFAERRPMVVQLSNIHDEAGNPLPAPAEAFSLACHVLTESQLWLHHAGVNLDPERWQRLAARILEISQQTSDPSPVGLALVEFIRETASLEPRVGAGVMLNNLPRAPGPPGGEILLVGKTPDQEVRTFTYIPEEGFEGRYLGPLVVGSDGSALGGFEAVGVGFPDSGAGMSYSGPDSSPPPKAAVGQAVRPVRIGRNDPCWCESGKKYKKCHGR